jgi:DNA polymerase-3 subunit delta
VAARRGKAAAADWEDVEPAPVVLVAGAESLLADRAVERLRTLCREARPDVEMATVEAATYESGQVATWTSPSLFGEPRLVVAENVEQCSDPFVTDVLAYLDDVQPDVVLVLRHGGGQRGKKLLDAVRGTPTAVVVDCPPLKKDAEKMEFLAAEFRRARRKASPAALRALMDAVGADLRELAAAAGQLMADVVDPSGKPADVDVTDVERYYGGRAEVTGFKVADAAVAGQCELALGLLRQALGSGVDPVPLVAAIAMKVRTMIKVAGAGRGRSVDLARGLGLAPWQVDRARKDLQGWTPEGLASSLLALAEADTAVKGGGRDPVYALEKAVVTITAARG